MSLYDLTTIEDRLKPPGASLHPSTPEPQRGPENILPKGSAKFPQSCNYTNRKLNIVLRDDNEPDPNRSDNIPDAYIYIHFTYFKK